MWCVGGGGLSKNVGLHGWPGTKMLKLHWLKFPKTVPKNKLWSLFTNFTFSGKKFQSQQKLAKKDHSFYNRVLLKNLTHSTNLLSLNIKKNTPPTQPKICFWLTSGKNCSLGALGKQLSVYSCKLCSNIFFPETQEAFLWWGAE